MPAVRPDTVFIGGMRKWIRATESIRYSNSLSYLRAIHNRRSENIVAALTVQRLIA